MSRFKSWFLIIAGLTIPAMLLVSYWSTSAAQNSEPQNAVGASAVAAPPSKLTIVWTSGDPEVAHRMVLMYGHAAKKNKWFDEVRVIIWGASSRLTAADKDIQSKLADMQSSGIVLEACVVCADTYGVANRLRELGIDVKPMGKPLTEAIKDPGVHVVTF